MMLSTVVILAAGVTALLFVTLRRRWRRGTGLASWGIADPADFDVARIATLSSYPNTFAVEVSGESHYQEALDRFAGGKTRGGHKIETSALLVPYRSPHDENAVAVLIGESEIIGHLNRDDARRHRDVLTRIGLGGCFLKVPAMVVGGWSKTSGDGYYGVKLDLPSD